MSSPAVPYLIRPSRWYDLFAIHRLVDTTYDPLVERFKIPRFPQRTKYFSDDLQWQALGSPKPAKIGWNDRIGG